MSIPSSSYSPSYDSFHSQTHYSRSYSGESDMSTQSTPSKRGVAGVSDPILSNLLPHLRQDVEGKFYYPVSLQDFVHHVWGVKPEVTQRILSAEWKLKPDLQKKYEAVKMESEMYAPFAEIAEDLVDRVRGFMGEREESPIMFWNARGSQVIRTKFTKRKPDMLTMRRTVKHPEWLMVRQIIEFKRKDKGVSQARMSGSGSSFTGSLQSVGEGLALEISSGVGSHQAGHSRTLAPSKAGISRRGSVSGHRSKRRGSTLNPNGTVPKLDTVPSPTVSQKRKGTDNEDRIDSKRSRIYPRMTLEQLQLATYALESMAATTRHYTSGIFIDRFVLSLWYYDRACIIRTQDFNFGDHPETLALILYALSVCDDKHTGLDPHLIPGPTTDDTSRDPIVGSHIKFPSSGGKPTDFQIKESLFEYRGLIGCGTMVYRVSRADQGDGEDEALKVSWPVTVRKREAYIIDKVVKDIPEWKDHLPEVKFLGAWTAADLQLPRVGLLKTISTLEFEDRELHAFSMKLSKKLWQMDSVEEFKQVYIDCVECHYHAFTVAKVLHRDLSENNLMFRRKDGIIKGVVNDWDMASILDDNGDVSNTTAKHRTGTIPFMARDLLAQDPPPHLYRHDLESFFFILVWATINYDLIHKQRRKIQGDLLLWDSADMLTVLKTKRAFISDYEDADAIFSYVRTEYRGIREEWLDPLWTLFQTSTSSKPKNSTLCPDYDHSTYGGHLTFYTFMEALGQKPRVFSNRRVGN